MKSSSINYGRPADSQRHIVQELRGQIVSGALAAGSRMPTRLEIERRFAAGATTVQRALEVLARDGFVESRGRRGTFVVENPPHLTRYALVFPLPTQAFSYNHFSTALNSEVGRLRRERPGIKIAEYIGVDGHDDSEDFQRLVREVRAHRVAGLIFASHPYTVRGTPLWDEPSLPRVAVMERDPNIDMPVVNLDMASFFARSLDSLKARGCRRVAFINPIGLLKPQGPTNWEERLRPMLAERGLETRPYWWQCIAPEGALAARAAAHLLMCCEQRPDALIISNDNLVEHATAGLVAAGTQVPDEISVVAHCNFPYPTPSVLPVQRLGFDARRVLQACMECIDCRRNGTTVPAVTDIEAIFEEELPDQFGAV